jgi:hypothetical protein
LIRGILVVGFEIEVFGFDCLNINIPASLADPLWVFRGKA